MSKNRLIALTIGLCIVSAGVGAFFAMRGRTASAPDPTAVASAPAAQVPGPTPVPAPVTSIEAAKPESATTPEPAATPSLPAPAPTPQAASVRQPSQPKAKAPTLATRQPAAPSAPATGSEPQGAGGEALPSTPIPVSEPSAEVSQPEREPSREASADTKPEPEPVYEDVVVTVDSVLGLRLESTVNSETARIEDPVTASVTRDVRAGSVVAIPTGTRVLGSVTQLERGGKMKTRARLEVRFHTLVMADGSRVSIHSEAIFREGEDPRQGAAGKVGAATAGGAILGAILGGGKGAAIGGAIGAAGGTAAAMNADRRPAVLLAGTPITVRLLQPVTITVER
jgi:type IV secretory pathway VirB10-like protein